MTDHRGTSDVSDTGWWVMGLLLALFLLVGGGLWMRQRAVVQRAQTLRLRAELEELAAEIAAMPDDTVVTSHETSVSGDGRVTMHSEQTGYVQAYRDLLHAVRSEVDAGHLDEASTLLWSLRAMMSMDERGK